MDSLSILDGGFYKWLKEVKDTESSDNVQTEEVNRMKKKKFLISIYLDRKIYCSFK